MKTINRFWAIMAAAGGLAMGACSSGDDNGKALVPAFPEVQTLTIAAGEEQEVIFEANMDWTLTSDRQWLKFADDIGDTQSLLGKAGSRTIRMKVSDGNLGFEPETASAALTMGGEKAVIFKVVRPAAERGVKMYTRVGSGAVTEVQKIAMGYEQTLYAGFSANFDWRVLSAPEWIVVNDTKDIRELAGKANEEKLERKDMAIMTVDPAVLYKDNSGEIVIGAQAGGVEFTRSFTVTAEGIAAGAIKWSQTNLVRNEGFIFTLAGMWHKNVGLSTYEDVDSPAAWSVRVRDYEFDVRLVEWTGSELREIEPSAAWVDITDDGQGSLTCRAVPNDGGKRELGLFIIPQGVTVDYRDYFSAEGKFLGGKYNDNGEFVRGEYAIRISQDGIVENPFTIKRYQTVLAPAREASEENKRLVKNLGIQTDVVFERAFTAEEWNSDGTYRSTIQIILGNPQYVEGNFVCYDENGEQLPFNSPKTNWGSIGMGSVSSGGGIQFAGATRLYESAKGHTCVVVYKDANDAALGAFLVLMQ